MATLKALKQIPKRYQFLASSLTKKYEKQLNLPNIPAIIKYLFILFYIESDEWIPNNFYLSSNQNKTIKHLKDEHKYSYIYGKVQMKGEQKENVIYQWSVRIDNCASQSICIGLINTEYVTFMNTEKQSYLAYVMNTPCHNWFKRIKEAEQDEFNLFTKSDIENIQKIIDDDLVKIKVNFSTNKDVKIEFFKNNNLIMSYNGIKSQYTYQLYIGMNSEGDEATIINFKTMCY